jgi:hypothetical protein
MEHHHHPAKGGHRRSGAERMPREIEWIVTRSPVRDADRRVTAEAESDGRSVRPVEKTASVQRAPRGERIAELHRQVRDGVYDSMSTIDTVARRILQSGDL